jgi:RNA polymerase sigma-70 factor (ECF subfamily)
MGLNTTGKEMSRILAEDWPAIGRFQNGDSTGFDDLMRRHWYRANVFACTLTKDSDEAADVVAEAFVRVLKSLGKFRGESSFSSWLYRIERNCFLDMRKKASSRSTLSLDSIEGGHDGLLTLQIADSAESAHEHLVRRERVVEIEAAMKKLPAGQNQAFLMYQADAMSYEAIAAELGIPMGTVKSRLNRARHHIRRAIRLQRRIGSA